MKDLDELENKLKDQKKIEDKAKKKKAVPPAKKQKQVKIIIDAQTGQKEKNDE